MSEPFKKTLKIGAIPPEGDSTNFGEVTLEIEIKHVDGKACLSICGEIGRSYEDEDGYETDDIWACGQIRGSLKQMYDEGSLKILISRSRFLTILEVWDRWHLNDMVAGCPHQMKILRADPERPRDYDELIKDPVFEECPECGYAYGSKWLYEEVPSEVLEFLESL